MQESKCTLRITRRGENGAQLTRWLRISVRHHIREVFIQSKRNCRKIVVGDGEMRRLSVIAMLLLLTGTLLGQNDGHRETAIAGETAAGPVVNGLPTIMKVYGEIWQGQLGACVSELGDINHDGWPDFGVGASNVREFRIYLGGKNILDSLPDLILHGGANAVVGDFNCDGVQDIATVRLFTVFPDEADTLYVYLGDRSRDMLYKRFPDYWITDVYRGFRDNLGVGDFNHDGCSDIVLGIPYSSYGGPNSGAMYIYVGNAAPPDRHTAAIALHEEGFRNLGQVLCVGDVNGDGIDDLASGRDAHIANSQKLIYHGRPGVGLLVDRPDQIIDSRNVNAGTVTASLADLNNDGTDDFIYRMATLDAAVHYGSAAGFSPVPDRVITPPEYGSMKGSLHAVRRLDHDITGDGIRDYVVSTRDGFTSGVFFYRGSPNGILGSPFASAYFGMDSHYGLLYPRRVCSIGDVNGDGRNDVLISSPDGGNSSGFFHILSGIGPPVTVPGGIGAPNTAALAAIRPNPAQGHVEMELVLPSASHVRVMVHDALGREMGVITDAHYGAATHTLRWNGREMNGARVAPGIYFLHLSSGSNISVERVLMQ